MGKKGNKKDGRKLIFKLTIAAALLQLLNAVVDLIGKLIE